MVGVILDAEGAHHHFKLGGVILLAEGEWDFIICSIAVGVLLFKRLQGSVVLIHRGGDRKSKVIQPLLVDEENAAGGVISRSLGTCHEGINLSVILL